VRVEKLVVFRGLYLGDLVAATGALRALRRGHPGAEITLVSLPWATALAPHLLPHVDRLLSYPGAPGLDGGGDEEILEEVLAWIRFERFDLAVNMHGRGPTSTRLVARFGARRTASFAGETGEYIPTLDVEVHWMPRLTSRASSSCWQRRLVECLRDPNQSCASEQRTTGELGHCWLWAS
jgi:ADP-heptose:LPS heptosyltransferase